LERKRKDCSKSIPLKNRGFHLITKMVAIGVLLVTAGRAQTPGPNTPPANTALGLYRQILNPVLNPADVHHLREVAIDREDLHISLTDGTIALFQAVDGHVTGAFFQGDGEILLVPPNRAERTSLALFTKHSVLDEHFDALYIRFFDDKLLQELRSGFRQAEDASQFVAQYQQAAQTLARADSLQLLQAMTNSGDAASRFLHMRVAGRSLGVFDVFFNTNAAEQISAAQPSQGVNSVYYDVWTSFPMRSVRDSSTVSRVNPIHISDFRIKANIHPPRDLDAEAELTLTARRPGQRTLLLQLSRYLKVAEVKVDGKPADFIQNEAIDGSELARQGNDVMAVVLPAALEKDHPVKLDVKYSGGVMFDAGADLLYVGARGTWYPNAGPSFANFDLTFEYPVGWTLVATGKHVLSATQNQVQTARFVSEKPISHAGFNLGKFVTASASTGGVVVDSYAAKNVEQPLARTEAHAGFSPEPAKAVQRTAHQAAATIEFLSSELDAFPYSNLEVTQLPALLSQSWPGLIYLSSMAFLTPQERAAAGVRDPFVELMFNELMLSHETAHQWWGDAIDWDSYRDTWIMEALANYSALVMLERENPQKMSVALEHYRTDLLKETGNGIMDDAGPVTLGERLVSSKFPQAYQEVLYGRGTWLIHMLRMMLRQASGDSNDALFFKALKGLLAKSPSGKISTRDLQKAFEQVLPASLAYEGQHNLDWFFDGWVNGTSIPEFSLENLRIAPAGPQVRISGVIRESHAANDLVTAVPVYGTSKTGKQQFLGFVFVDEEKTEFTLKAPVGTADVTLDPEFTILRR
jgi:peptidase M1-like protein